MSFSRKIWPPSAPPAPLYPPGYVPPKGFRLVDGRLVTELPDPTRQPPPVPQQPATRLEDGEDGAAFCERLRGGEHVVTVHVFSRLAAVDRATLAAALEVTNREACRAIAAICARL